MSFTTGWTEKEPSSSCPYCCCALKDLTTRIRVITARAKGTTAVCPYIIPFALQCHLYDTMILGIRWRPSGSRRPLAGIYVLGRDTHAASWKTDQHEKASSLLGSSNRSTLTWQGYVYISLGFMLDGSAIRHALLATSLAHQAEPLVHLIFDSMASPRPTVNHTQATQQFG